jgi:acetylornithine deacetylase/succinyl-diaminopimelate desuccinylase-like protein
MTVEKILGLIDSWKGEIVDFTAQLVATPSETPTGDEQKITQVLLNKFNQLGLTGAEITSSRPEHPNILYRLAGNGHGRTLLYVAHTDTKKDVWSWRGGHEGRGGRVCLRNQSPQAG